MRDGKAGRVAGAVVALGVVGAVVALGLQRLPGWGDLTSIRNEGSEERGPGDGSLELFEGAGGAGGRPPDEPPPPAGSPLDVELTQPPAARYGPREPTEADRLYARLVRDTEGLRYDPALGHAARELASFHAAHGELAPGGVLDFLLDAGGAAAWGVRQAVRTTGADGTEPLRKVLRRAARRHADDGPPLRVGLGEAWSMGDPARRHVALLAHAGQLRLDAVPRLLEPGQRVEVSGALPPGVEGLEVLAMGPDGAIREVPAQRRGDGFTAEVVAGEQLGRLEVELIADGAGGPHPLAQLALHVGRRGAEPRETLPNLLETRWLPDPEPPTTEEAEAIVAGLVEDDRARHGLGPLARDGALARVARRHSRDMRDEGFVGHVSPTTGGPGDRLDAAGIRTVEHAENVARDGSLHGAEAGLMRSLGHRRNILSEAVTRLGVGVAAAPPFDEPAPADGERTWYVTQLFARPVPDVDPDRARRRVLEALRAARRREGVEPLRTDAELSDAAMAQARSGRPTPDGVLDRAEGALPRGGWASVGTVARLESLEVPEKVLDVRWDRVGVGVHQNDGRDGATIVVVLVVGA